MLNKVGPVLVFNFVTVPPSSDAYYGPEKYSPELGKLDFSAPDVLEVSANHLMPDITMLTDFHANNPARKATVDTSQNGWKGFKSTLLPEYLDMKPYMGLRQCLKK